MKRTLITLAVSLLLLSCQDKRKAKEEVEIVPVKDQQVQPEDEVKNDLASNMLRGNVKWFRFTQYTAIDKFGDILKVETVSRQTYWKAYNRAGNETEQKGYGIDGNMLGGYERDYDRGGKVVLINQFDSGGKISTSQSYKYDHMGNNIEMISYGKDGILAQIDSFIYDDRGYQIKRWAYREGELIYKIIYTNDNRGNQIEEKQEYFGIYSYTSFTTKTYDEKNNVIDQNSWTAPLNSDTVHTRYMNILDSVGNTIEAIGYRGDSIHSNHFVSYDNMRNIIKSKSYSSDGTLYNYVKNEYEYDDQGNWIKRIGYSNSIPTVIDEREIKYYE